MRSSTHIARTSVRSMPEAAGLRQHYVLVNRESGRIEIIGVWETADSVAGIAPMLVPARQRLWAQLGTSPPLEIFDVADELR